MEIAFLKQLLLKGHSKINTKTIVDLVLNEPALFEQFLGLVAANEPIIAQRASWVLSDAVKANKAFGQKNQLAIIQLLRIDGHPAIKRHSFKALAAIKIDEDYQGLLVEYAFKALADSNNPVGIKAIAMECIANAAKLYPELLGELQMYIEAQLPYQSPGFKSKAKIILTDFQKR